MRLALTTLSIVISNSSTAKRQKKAEMRGITVIVIFIGIIIAVTGAFNITNDNHNGNKSIVFKINFKYYQTIHAGWSSTKERRNILTYFLTDIRKYANSFDEFKKKYPSVTIRTKGRAMSFSTFGDVGKNKFGPINYATNNFSKNKNIHLVDIFATFDGVWGAYYVEVVFGIGFARRDTKLFLIPYTNGKITSHGFMERFLDFGFTVETITFNPYLDVDSLTSIPWESWFQIQ